MFAQAGLVQAQRCKDDGRNADGSANDAKDQTNQTERMAAHFLFQSGIIISSPVHA